MFIYPETQPWLGRLGCTSDYVWRRLTVHAAGNTANVLTPRLISKSICVILTPRECSLHLCFFFFLSQKPGQGRGMPRPWAFVSSSVRRDRQLPRHPELCLREHGVQLRTWGARAPRKPSALCPRSLSAGRMWGRTGVGGLPRGWERPRPHGHLTPRGRQPWPHGEIVRPTRCPSRPAR